MSTRQYLLFAIPTLIWGSTWYVIRFQLGTVDPLLSVAYRFILAGLLLIIFCLISGRKMKFKPREHFLMFLLGVLLFGINYWFVYKAETMLTSGIVAVVFSLIIFFNIFFNAIFLKGKIKKDVVFAAILGVGGTALLFKNEFGSLSLKEGNWVVLLFCLGGLVFASLGNILSAYNQRHKLPVIQVNAYGMLYGGLSIFIIAMIWGKPLIFDTSMSYSFSLLYLALLGSIVAFSAYLKLLGEIGPDRSIYTTLISPVIALLISTVFESYHWDVYALVGIALLFSGNILALRVKKFTAEKRRIIESIEYGNK